MSDNDSQQQLVLWGYVIQSATLLMPLPLLVSCVYLLLVRGRVSNPALRSHMDWQLTTCVLTMVFFTVAAVLFVVGLSGVNTDSPVSIIATFTVVGLVTVAPLWFLYRLIRGILRFAQKLPVEKLIL